MRTKPTSPQRGVEEAGQVAGRWRALPQTRLPCPVAPRNITELLAERNLVEVESCFGELTERADRRGAPASVPTRTAVSPVYVAAANAAHRALVSTASTEAVLDYGDG